MLLSFLRPRLLLQPLELLPNDADVQKYLRPALMIMLPILPAAASASASGDRTPSAHVAAAAAAVIPQTQAAPTTSVIATDCC